MLSYWDGFCASFEKLRLSMCRRGHPGFRPFSQWNWTCRTRLSELRNQTCTSWPAKVVRLHWKRLKCRSTQVFSAFENLVWLWTLRVMLLAYFHVQGNLFSWKHGACIFSCTGTGEIQNMNPVLLETHWCYSIYTLGTRESRFSRIPRNFVCSFLFSGPENFESLNPGIREWFPGRESKQKVISSIFCEIIIILSLKCDLLSWNHWRANIATALNPAECAFVYWRVPRAVLRGNVVCGGRICNF